MAHHAVISSARSQTIVGWVDAYRFRNVRAVVQTLKTALDTLVAGLAQLSQQIQLSFHVRRASARQWIRQRSL